ncbi:TPA: type I-E CRISPR-associated protein Cas5/CasD [Aeromonas veronii]|uniref:Type I-E CRISPR-associated protein Cas5/CasD n=1 Tax=Aeromonas veronii TaxID=654 RepID=A0A4S5CMW3_AERVE|nr:MULTISPECIES: type I-E CRISPR-associated protein Cas5/CasD [Aeromonas]MCF5728619.1 type I-E CRISPR-associated protein Cas5/CasD [Aeromonas veronii]MCF5910215.1 type I-E CRISPR-associated protein Cas5/CasD [Aeromonas veronii]MCZ0751069.1 type I-E CRISPR-associated protein Cas5/CasD [Aeromonas enteropelogenes]THJ47180.1 type I-E CRISPR-associated protein Cas5/CasD [Aeromonas veronii]
MPTLLLRLQGPMQSWGTTSRFDERDTQLEPSKSGVLGLICAALGRDRSESVDDLAALQMGVRVDREGVVLRDYQTATGIVNAAGKVDMKRTVVSPRYYLSDAAFLVGFEGEQSLLDQIHQALKTPHWPLSLGRKGCLPSPPVYLPDGVRDSALLEALRDYPELIKGAGLQVRRLLLEATEGTVRLDQPIAPFADRRFGPRFVLTEQLEPEEVSCP